MEPHAVSHACKVGDGSDCLSNSSAQRRVFGLIDRCSVKELFAQLDGMDNDRAQPHVAANFVVIDWCPQLFLVCIPPADGITQSGPGGKTTSCGPGWFYARNEPSRLVKLGTSVAILLLDNS